MDSSPHVHFLEHNFIFSFLELKRRCLTLQVTVRMKKMGVIQTFANLAGILRI